MSEPLCCSGTLFRIVLQEDQPISLQCCTDRTEGTGRGASANGRCPKKLADWNPFYK